MLSIRIRNAFHRCLLGGCLLGASCQLLVVVFFWSGCCVGAVKVAHQMVVVVFSTGVEWGGGGCMMWHPGVWLSSLGGCHGVRAARVAQVLVTLPQQH